MVMLKMKILVENLENHYFFVKDIEYGDVINRDNMRPLMSESKWICIKRNSNCLDNSMLNRLLYQESTNLWQLQRENIPLLSLHQGNTPMMHRFKEKNINFRQIHIANVITQMGQKLKFKTNSLSSSPFRIKILSQEGWVLLNNPSPNGNSHAKWN